MRGDIHSEWRDRLSIGAIDIAVDRVKSILDGTIVTQGDQS